MRLQHLLPIAIFAVSTFAAVYAVGHNTLFRSTTSNDNTAVTTEQKQPQRKMVDMVADDSYLVDQGDSTIFILVGNFAAHHNGAVILADSAVRYSNQSFECFGDVLINQNSTYIYGDRAEYNSDLGMVKVYSDLVKVVDGEATMYTYDCTFDTVEEIGTFDGGCYVINGNSLMESERGFYNTKTHELTAIERVEMQDEVYLMKGDSIIYNTESEDARYFHNTNIWNDKEEYLYADEGSYTKSRDLHHLTRNAYILSPEREIWSDTIEYYRTEGHIIGRRNIQMDDTTRKVLGFADYGEWWDEPGNALFTRRPAMINYDTRQTDSLFLSADTLWLYTIAVEPPMPRDTTATQTATQPNATSQDALIKDEVTDNVQDAETGDLGDGKQSKDEDKERKRERKKEKKDAESETQNTIEEALEQNETPKELADSTENNAQPTDTTTLEQPNTQAAAETTAKQVDTNVDTEVEANVQDEGQIVIEEGDADTTIGADSLVTAQKDTIPLTQKQIRQREKIEARRVSDSLKMLAKAERDSLKAIKIAERDSLRAIEQAERDSLRHIRDSILDIKLDSIIAKRKARNARLADEEKARMERIKQKAEERHRRKIDKAKARAARRGKVYTGEEYAIDTLTTDADSIPATPVAPADSLATDIERGATDSLTRDSLAAPTIAKDSSYKLVKAYRNVRMYRSDSQIICDSLVTLNTDSIIRLYIDPVMWNEQNQITSDSMAIYTTRQNIAKVHFMGDPLMGTEIDTMYYNQVKGKDMVAHFTDGRVSSNVVEGNAQTIYYMQDEEDPLDVTGLMYIESSGITFYLVDGQMDHITYRQNPDYVLYPINMVPETQELRLPDFKWHYDRRPTRDSVFSRTIRFTQREVKSNSKVAQFPITKRIDYDRKRLTENGAWVDRVDELTPEVIEWRDSRRKN